MATNEPKVLRDGMMTAEGGVDSGRSPSIIDPNQIAYAVNVSLRGAYVENRNGYTRQTLAFDTTEQEDWFQTHKIQGRGTFLGENNQRLLVVMVAGRLFSIDPNNGSVREVTPTFTVTTNSVFTAPAVDATVSVTLTSYTGIYEGYPLSVNGYTYMVTARVLTGLNVTSLTLTNLDDDSGETYASGTTCIALDPGSAFAEHVYFCQAQRWLVVQNKRDKAILFDGNISRRSKQNEVTVPEVPTGGPMVYANARLWIAINDYEVVAGDLAYGTNSVINFEETTVANEGGSFRFSEPITAMATTTNVDTSMGQGPILVFSRNAICSINVPVDRTQWKNLSYPAVTVVCNYGGTEAPDSVLQVNSDIFYRAPDGVRSFMLSRREGTEWGNVPVSMEMNRILTNDNELLVPFTSAMMLDNRLLMTCAPLRVGKESIVSRGLLALDFSTISRMGKKAPPAWEGLWGDITPITVVSANFSGRERGFAFVTNLSNENELWEIDPYATVDHGSNRITSLIETRSFTFQNPFELKEVFDANLWVDGVKGTVDLDLKYRPDQSPCWFDWRTRQICVKDNSCAEDAGYPVEALYDNDIFPMGFPDTFG